jgi:hypothetical protein
MGDHGGREDDHSTLVYLQHLAGSRDGPVSLPGQVGGFQRAVTPVIFSEDSVGTIAEQPGF